MNKTAPSVKDRKKFDIDLEYGKIRESQVLDMFENAKIEVKSERDIMIQLNSETLVKLFCTFQTS